MTTGSPKTCDFTLAEEVPVEDVVGALAAVYEDVRRASGVAFRYARGDPTPHQNSRTFYLAYEGPLPATSPKEVKVDITLRERFVCPVSDRLIVRGYHEYADLPEDRSVRVYALEEIAVEKVAALTDRARTEPRDLYDLWYLTSGKHVDLGMLGPELEHKLDFRGRTLTGMSDELDQKEVPLRKLWSARLGAQMAQLPPFDDVYRAVRRTLRSSRLLDR